MISNALENKLDDRQCTQVEGQTLWLSQGQTYALRD